MLKGVRWNNKESDRGLSSLMIYSLQRSYCLFAAPVRSQVSDSFGVQCVSALVLDEDGTGVDMEEFFQTLTENTVLMVLEKGEKWTQHPVCI